MTMKPTILVVDDDLSVLESLTKFLRSEGFDVLSARDGLEALELFKWNPVNLVVLDLNLGADDGWKVFHKMVELKPFVPTVIITAEFGQEERAADAGVEALIEKPIDVSAFLKMIHDLLKETSQQRIERICGGDRYCQYVAHRHKIFLRMLAERRSAPMTFSKELQVALSNRAALGVQTNPQTGRSVAVGSFPNVHKTRNTCENNSIDRKTATHTRPVTPAGSGNIGKKLLGPVVKAARNWSKHPAPARHG